ncbi:hypothetical protein MKUB_14620 [Mycobacterium kubicae]|uniref:Uncharacterized protein n=1 Tax=Mycobacterium kubicae TaxID=120959 RepID=A0AAX1JGB0_9MYCO|nr:hypothetical protein [Mycobacterium kubicae]MCV7097642.1 hypothetical protein [Mycobacterium kubicae]QNI11176.1 hypothetical protein GAN18_08135 [Mycobacterium kubicae]QPI39390.1 hypothetical protein I2456_08000 [Mycobacterium kubicae]GFG63972.1 hypothetical protein MKUB_14620 [Mycobacterium kubicae]
MERYQRSQLRSPELNDNEFDLCSGEELERWLLKVIWGAAAAASSVPDNLKTAPLSEVLASYLFRDGLLPRHWGLYLTGSPNPEVTPSVDIGLEVRSEVHERRLLTATVFMGAVRFTLALGPLEAGNGAFAIHRPSAVCLHSSEGKALIVLALSWDHGRKSPAVVVDLRSRRLL